jgi:hypothetical protein
MDIVKHPVLPSSFGYIYVELVWRNLPHFKRWSPGLVRSPKRKMVMLARSRSRKRLDVNMQQPSLYALRSTTADESRMKNEGSAFSAEVKKTQFDPCSS